MSETTIKCGILGLGRLGMPVALAIARKFPVIGYDISPECRQKRKYPYLEKGPTLEDNFQEVFDSSTIRFAENPEHLAKESDLIFVVVQTPHDPQFDGSKILGSERKDFSYTYLKKACQDLAPHVKSHHTVVVVSTVLPGTMRREVLPILKGRCKLAYHPLFAAMGEVMWDFDNPEFVLIGEDSTDWDKGERDSELLKRFYSEYYFPKNVLSIVMSYESAELTKVSYNTAITNRICIANTIMEIAHKIPYCNCDHVSFALENATKRIASGRYLRGGQGEGGMCHPRDLISMSWLAREYSIGSTNIFDSLIYIREDQAEWLVKLFLKHAKDMDLKLLGRAFKPETNITAGSAALLVADLLRTYGRRFTQYDPFVDGFSYFESCASEKAAYLIATNHKCFQNLKFTEGSIIIDPFRQFAPQEGVEIIHVGIGK